MLIYNELNGVRFSAEFLRKKCQKGQKWHICNQVIMSELKASSSSSLLPWQGMDWGGAAEGAGMGVWEGVLKGC